MESQRAIAYHLLEGRRRKELVAMEMIIVDELLVQDSDVITSASPATAVNVAFTLLEELISRDNALAVRMWVGFK